MEKLATGAWWKISKFPGAQYGVTIEAWIRGMNLIYLSPLVCLSFLQVAADDVARPAPTVVYQKSLTENTTLIVEETPIPAAEISKWNESSKTNTSNEQRAMIVPVKEAFQYDFIMKRRKDKVKLAEITHKIWDIRSGFDTSFRTLDASLTNATVFIAYKQSYESFLMALSIKDIANPKPVETGLRFSDSPTPGRNFVVSATLKQTTNDFPDVHVVYGTGGNVDWRRNQGKWEQSSEPVPSLFK